MNRLPFIYPINCEPYGLTYEQWTVSWWKWLLRIPKRFTPLMDPSGDKTSIGQNNSNVFFLCQTFENSASVPTRCVTIAKQKSIFMPLINWISVIPEDGKVDSELIDKAKMKMDVIQDLRIVINGRSVNKRLENYRVRSKPFDYELPDDNILDLDPGYRRFASDGYWVMIGPLQRSISVETFGSCTRGLTKIAVSYDIIMA